MQKPSLDGSDHATRATPNAGGGRDPLTPAESEFVRELFEKHRFSLARYLHGLVHSREEAHEILQETYLRLVRQPSFDHVRHNARAYLFQTATNLARDYFRQRTAKSIDMQVTAATAGGLNAIDWMSWPEFALEGEQLAAAIMTVLKDMERPVRSALLLHRFRSLTYAQIGKQLGVSERTIDRYIKEGLNAIAQQLEVKP